MFRANERHRQGELLSTVAGLPQRQARRLEESWAGTFYRDFFCQIDEHLFAVLYSAKDSRPNIAVNVLVCLEALKAGFNWSDEEMYDAFCFDLQVRFALGYRTLGEGDFELRTVYNFRRRLNAHRRATGEDLIARSFEQVSDACVRAFAVKTGKLRMDSSQIASNMRTLSRLHLLVEIVQRVHRMLSAEDQARYAEVFAPYLQGSSGQYVYRVKSQEGIAHMQQLGEVMLRLLGDLEETYKTCAPYQMLQRVFTEHFLVEQERLRLKAGEELSAASLQSPDDPEATFRRKNGREYKGHVTNVTETADPDNPLQLIVKVQTAPNVTNDDDLLIEAVPALKERWEIDEIHTDGGYNSAESAAVLEEHGITHVQTGLRGHAPHRHIGLEQFTLTLPDAEGGGVITCPHGQTVALEGIAGKHGARYRAHFALGDCVGCPFEATCLARPTTTTAQRTLSFDPHDREIARRRQRMAQDRQAGRYLRVAIESTLASLKHPFNYAQLPVRGVFRVGMMLIGCAAMANVRRIHRYITRHRPLGGARSQATASPAAPDPTGAPLGAFVARVLATGLPDLAGQLPVHQRFSLAH